MSAAAPSANDTKPTEQNRDDFMTYCWDELCCSFASDFKYPDDKIDQRLIDLVNEHLPRLVEKKQYKGAIDEDFELELHERILKEVKEISLQREAEDEKEDSSSEEEDTPRYSFDMFEAPHATNGKYYIVDAFLTVYDECGEELDQYSAMIESCDEPNDFFFDTDYGNVTIKCEFNKKQEQFYFQVLKDGAALKKADVGISNHKYKSEEDDPVWELLGYKDGEAAAEEKETKEGRKAAAKQLKEEKKAAAKLLREEAKAAAKLLKEENKVAAKAAKVALAAFKKIPDDLAAHPWFFQGQNVFAMTNGGGVWERDAADKIGKWVGKYDPATGVLDTTAVEPDDFE